MLPSLIKTLQIVFSCYHSHLSELRNTLVHFGHTLGRSMVPCYLRLLELAFEQELELSYGFL